MVAESVAPTEPNTTCSEACHVCGDPDPLHGCSSCGRICHADCRSELCALKPCGECLSCDIATHLNSDLCKEVQRDNLGCHECHRMYCCASALDCHARCRKFAHFCRAAQGNDPSCSSCGKTCHLDSSDPRCDFFGQDRGNLPFHDGIVDAEQFRDTQAGTGGSLPHFSQVVWSFTNAAGTELSLNGDPYRKGSASGMSNNCLIDSLCQTLNMQCNHQLVRKNLLDEFGMFAPTDRRHVTSDSFLDVDCHWRSILISLSQQVPFDISEYRIVALYADVVGNGVVLGNTNARHSLVIVNTGNMHFEPCFRVV